MTTTSPFPAKRALLIGIGRYAHLPPERQLHGPPADVAALADLLTNAHAFDHITTLVDEQATRKAILDAFADLVDATQPGDLVMIHYSGHGSRVPDIHGDEADGWDSSLVPHDGRDSDGLAPDILDDELNPFFGRLVNERQAGDLVLIFDSCHSAGMTRADGDAPFPAWSRSLEPPTPVAGSRLVESAAAASAAPPPMWQPAGEQFIAFYACQGAESAFELKLTANTVHGALSHALLTALAGGDWLLGQGRAVEFLSLVSPNGWPAALDGWPPGWGLSLALGAWTLWCGGLMPRVWRTRRGLVVAWRLFVHRLFAERVTYWFAGLWAIGTAIIGLAAWRFWF